MKKKLSLRIHEEAIERAEAYADERGTSVPELVEQFFESLREGKEAEDVEISPFVASLRGVAAGEVSEEDYRRHLEEKYRSGPATQTASKESASIPGTGIKEQAHKLVDELPDDATWEDLEYKIYVRRKIERGLESIEKDETVSTDEVRARFGLDKK